MKDMHAEEHFKWLSQHIAACSRYDLKSAHLQGVDVAKQMIDDTVLQQAPPYDALSGLAH